MSIMERFKAKPWLLNYLKFKLANATHYPVYSDSPIHIIFLFVDHFEPKENTTVEAEQDERIRCWVEEYPELAMRHHDSDGVHPQHTWFYLVEDWVGINRDITYLKQLGSLCYDGFGEVELHVHHGPPSDHCFPDVDNSEKLADLINRLKNLFGQTGALVTAETVPKKVFGFIHGKWALDNSQDGKYCGVNDELELLSKVGCYADFTMPSGEDKSQSKKINSIYYAEDDPNSPKSYDDGIDVQVGGRQDGDLMIFSGMLDIYFNNILNSRSIVEKSNIDFRDFPDPERVNRWVECNVHVKGRPEWIFVKIHTHGAREENVNVCLRDIADNMYSYLEEKFNDGEKFKLHYVTAREAYNMVKAAEAGETGNPSEYRNYLIAPYANSRIKSNVLFHLKSYTKNMCRMEIIERRGDVRIELKEFLLSEIKGGSIKYFDYFLDQKKREIMVLMGGKGEVKCKLSLPILSAKYELNVSGAKITEESNLAGNKECWLSADLSGRDKTGVVVNW